MNLHELVYACRLYAAFSDFDSAIKKFRRVTGSDLDLSNPTHRKALLVWLNSWGCRQFAKDYHRMASKALLEWRRRYLHRLPRKDVALTELSDEVLDAAAEAYADLMSRRASMRVSQYSSSTVTFGPTGTAKVLYALRPNALPPWDDPIREHFGYDGSPDSYRQFLRSVQKEISSLVEEAARFGIKASDIPATVGRPESSLPKLIDEYYWVTITKGCTPPTGEELERWVRWARGRRG